MIAGNTVKLLRLLSFALVALPTFALASGLGAARFGGEHGHPTTDNVTAIYFNPAGLSLRSGTRLHLNYTLAMRDFTFDRDPGGIDNIVEDGESGTGTPAGEGVAINSGKGTLSNLVGAPFIGAVTDFGVEGLGVGLAFYVPFGGSSVWDKQPTSENFPGAVDGSNRWWIIEGSIRALYFTGGLAYRSDAHRLSLGISVSAVLSQMNTLRARNSDGTDSVTSGGNLQEGRAHVDVAGLDVAFALGFLWEPLDNLHVGFSYTSQPGLGETKMTGETTLVLGGGPIDSVMPTESEFFHAWPDILRLGVRYTEPRSWEVRASAELVRWSHFERQCLLNTAIADRACTGDPPPGKIVIIPRHWEDAFGVRLGASWWAADAAELYLGAGWDGNAVPDRTIGPALYDTEKWTAAVGGKFRLLDDQLTIGFTFTQIIYPERTVAPRGRVDTDGSGGTVSDLSALGNDNAVRNPDGAGTYTHSVSLFDLYTEIAF